MEFVARHGATSRYTSEWSRWHLWDGNLWRPDEKRRVFSMAQEVCRDAARKANTILSGKTRAQVVSLTGEHPLIATAPREWDRDPWLLGTPGGVVDLRTGELRPGDPILMVTKSTSVAPGGDCPLWRKTLDDIFKEDREVIAFAKRHAGYLLTGSIKKEKLVFALGDGGNGKGTVFETLAYVMGEYAMSCPIETLVQTHGSQHPTEIAQFQAKRFALASEPDEAHRWNTARVKLLTGGDRLRARVMRGDFFDFEPTHKLVITGNDTPRFGRIDAAISRRLEIRRGFRQAGPRAEGETQGGGGGDPIVDDRGMSGVAEGRAGSAEFDQRAYEGLPRQGRRH